MLQVQKPGPGNFDFWLHTWDVHNKRKKVRSLYDDPQKNQEAEWEEFSAVCGMGTKYCDGRVMVDHYEGTFPSGQIVKGVNVRAYNPESGEWSLVWLDNRQAPISSHWLVNSSMELASSGASSTHKMVDQCMFALFLTISPKNPYAGSRPSHWTAARLGISTGLWNRPEDGDTLSLLYEGIPPWQ